MNKRNSYLQQSTLGQMMRLPYCRCEPLMGAVSVTDLADSILDFQLF